MRVKADIELESNWRAATDPKRTLTLDQFDMRFSFLCLLLLGLAPVSVQAESVDPDPNDWFKNQYAPLWKENPWDKVDEIAKFYGESVGVHPPRGAVPVVTSRLWLSRGIDGWRSEGWFSSVLAGYQSNMLNPSTVLIKAKWLDLYSDGSKEFSCGWYLADFDRGRWSFTEYAEIECTDHNL